MNQDWEKTAFWKASLYYDMQSCHDWDRKSYFHFRFVGFKWTSSLAEDIVKRLLIQWSQNEQLSGEVENGSLDPVVSTITTQMPLKFFVHYCFKWTMKCFYELLSQYAWYQKESDPFFCLLINRQQVVSHAEISAIYMCIFSKQA